MKTIAAYLLLSLGGKPATEASIAELLSSVGVEADADASARLVAAVADKSIDEVLAAGLVKIESIPALGGGGGGGGGAAAGGAGAAAEEAPVEEEEEVEEVSMGSGNLFGDDDEGGDDY